MVLPSSSCLIDSCNLASCSGVNSSRISYSLPSLSSSCSSGSESRGNSSFNFFLSITNNLNKNTIFTPELHTNTPKPFTVALIALFLFYYGNTTQTITRKRYVLCRPGRRHISRNGIHHDHSYQNDY